MATSQINLPPGFELETGDNSVSLPPGFVLEEKKKTSWTEDLAISGVQALGTLQKADAGLRGAVAGMLGDKEWQDRIFQERAARGKAQEQWANPEGKEQGLGGKVVGALGTLPLQIAAMPFSPFDTGQTMIDNGESLGTAQTGAAIDTVGNMVGVALPGAVGKKLLPKALSGFGINAAQDTAVRLALQGISDKEATKKAFAPSVESAAVSGIVGGATGMLAKTEPTKAKPRPKVNVDDVVTTTVETPKVADVDPNIEFWKQRAEKIQQEALAAEAPPPVLRAQMADPFNPYPVVSTPEVMEGISRSTENLTYNQVPEAGVIPRDSLFFNKERDKPMLRVPKGNEWSVDENGIPVRQGLPETTVAPDYINDFMRQDTQARNDIGNAIQEANGPKLGQQDTYGTQPLSGPMGAPSTSPYSGGFGRNQRGGVDLDALFTGVSDGFKKLGSLFGRIDIHDKQFLAEINDDLQMYQDTGNPAILNYLRQEVKARGYGSEIDQAFKDLVASAEKYNEAQLTQTAWKNMPFETRQKFNTAKQLFDLINANKIKADLIVKEHGLLEGNYSDWTRSQKYWARKATQIEDSVRLSEFGLASADEAYITGDKLNPRDLPYALEFFDVKKARAFLDEQKTDVPSKNVVSFKKKELGAVDIKAIVEGVAESMGRIRSAFGSKPDSLAHPTDPTTITQKQSAVRKLKALKETLPEWAKSVGSFEEAVVAGATAEDIKTSTAGKNVASGINFMAAYHKNPILNYARSLFMDARGEASSASRTHITNKENGIGTLITKMDKDEKIIISQLIHSLDKHQKAFTPEMGQKLGLSETGMKFMQSMEAIAKFDYEWKNKILSAQGKEAPRQRAGYAPSVFSGSYVSKVVDKAGNILGIIAADTPGEFMKAREHFLKSNPGAKLSADTWQEARKSISGNQNRGFILRDTMAVLNLLSQVDGDMAKAHVAIEQAIRRGANELWGMDKHELLKRGVEGNQGNKPWLSPEKNAQQRLDSLVRYYEEAFEYYSLQKPIEELNLLQKNEELGHLPNTFKYLNDYLANVLGTRVTGPGAAANWVFDNGHKLLENVAAKIPGARDVVGPGQTLRGSNIVKNKMSQIYMGIGNYMFTISQMLQPVQTGLPFLELVAERTGLDPASASKNLMLGAKDYFMLTQGMEVDPNVKTAALYGESRGIFDFTELERAYEGHKSKLGRTWDHLAEWNMQKGESTTRPPMFLGFVRMLLEAGYDIKEVLPAAENLTNQSMVDYHAYERPLLYGGLGVLGQHAGGLTTFKHNYLGTQVLLGKEAARPGMRSKAPLMLSGMAMMALAGLTGLPGYQEADWMYQHMREAATGERRSISQDVMSNLDQWVKSGVLSSALGLNMQGKFSAANMLPDSVGQALFPHLSGAYDIGKAAVEAAKNPNSTTGANLAMAATPSGFKRLTEAAVRKDEEGNVLNKRGQVEVHRSEEDWKKAMISGSLRPTDEAVKAEELYQDRMNEAAKRDRVKAITEKFELAVTTGDNEQIANLLNEYQDLTGVPPIKLLNRIAEIQREAGVSAKERAEGIPRSLEGIKRYEAYN